MNRTAIALALSATLLATSCGIATDSKAKDEEAALEAYILTIDSATAAIKKAQTAGEFSQITKAFAETARAFADAHSEANAPKPLLDKAGAAALKYQEAAMAKVRELAEKEARNYKKVE